MKNVTRIVSVFALAAVMSLSVATAADAGPHTSAKFEGPKANTGTVSHSTEGGKSILRVSSDFKVPDTPAPDLFPGLPSGWSPERRSMAACNPTLELEIS